MSYSIILFYLNTIIDHEMIQILPKYTKKNCIICEQVFPFCKATEFTMANMIAEGAN